MRKIEDYDFSAVHAGQDTLEELQNYLTDASFIPGAWADRLFIPETADEIAGILKEANEKQIPVTISGAEGHCRRRGPVWRTRCVDGTFEQDHVDPQSGDDRDRRSGRHFGRPAKGRWGRRTFLSAKPDNGAARSAATSRRTLLVHDPSNMVQRVNRTGVADVLASGERISLRRGESVADEEGARSN